MKIDRIEFQQKAIVEIRSQIDWAMQGYKKLGKLQVVSYTAPTGAGKTVIMGSVMERIICGDENFDAQENAIIVWLSDSPELNQQSKDKIDAKADKISLNQTVTIREESFNQEVLSDGTIYFLNTQKLGKNSNLTKHSDFRQYTIWETLANTVRTKGDRLYFIIDEAHRGSKGTEATKATTIMQKFLKGSEADGLPAMPVVIGITATPQRFNALVSGIPDATILKVTTTPEEVRNSGLLKERIIIEYPDAKHNNEIAVLQAATDEWKDKTIHWEQYCHEQHYAYVSPVMVLQVLGGSGSKLSDTNLDECLSAIETRLGEKFNEGEVVHTFGQTTSDVIINGLAVKYIEPSRIADDRNIKIVFFKENLSTGWDCPRAETMMSFRPAKDATYIAQLLGRMVRTPMRMRIKVDDSLNEVRLFLPHFDEQTVAQVIEQLKSDDGANFPSDVTGQSLGDKKVETLTISNQPKIQKPGITASKPATETQPNPFGISAGNIKQPVNKQDIKSEEQQTGVTVAPSEKNFEPSQYVNTALETETSSETPVSPKEAELLAETDTSAEVDDSTDENMIDRKSIILAVNAMCLPTYDVRSVAISNYFKSYMDLTRLLSQSGLQMDARTVAEDSIVEMIHQYVEKLHSNGKYDSLAESVTRFQLHSQTIDTIDMSVIESVYGDLFSTTDTDIDRRLRMAEARLGREGLDNKYGAKYFDVDNPNNYKIDFILFEADEDCRNRLEEFAKNEFHDLQDKYRIKKNSLPEKYQRLYDRIVSDGDPVSKHTFALPESVTSVNDSSGQNYPSHLYLNSKGEAWLKLNTWEQGVINEEIARPDFVTWVRNPSRGSWALTIPYELSGIKKPTYPDFIVIRMDTDGSYIVDLLEPHDPSRQDNLPKAKGFADYASQNPTVGRLQLIREVKDAAGKHYKRLDMTRSIVREAVKKAISNEELDHVFDQYGENN